MVAFLLQISGPGCKENQFFCIFKPSFRFVHWVGGKHFKPKSSKPCWTSWLLLRAWSVLAGIWILPKWFSAWLSSYEGWAQQTIVLEQPCEDCPWICKGIRVREALFFSMNIKQACQPFFLNRQVMAIIWIFRYLHETCSPSMVHKNFKSSNILLDSELNPHLSDSGFTDLIPNQEFQVWHKASDCLSNHFQGSF